MGELIQFPQRKKEIEDKKLKAQAKQLVKLYAMKNRTIPLSAR